MACFAQAAAALSSTGEPEFVCAKANDPSSGSLYDTCNFTNTGIFGEGERYAALESLQMLDTTTEEQPFNRITNLMTKVFQTPVSLITLVADPSRVWFKSKVGPFGACVDRDGSWCNYVLVPSTPEILITEDASLDARFAHNPYVAGEPFIKFYAGAPLVGSQGERYGTLCIVDLKQRAFSAELYALLINFAALTVEEIERNKPLYELATGITTNDVQNNRHLDMSLTGAREGIIMLDVRETGWPISYANPAFESASGLELDDLAGGDFWELFESAGKDEKDLGLIIGRGDSFEMRFFCSMSNKWLTMRLMPATTDRLAPSKATGIPSWAASVDDKKGTKLGLDVFEDKVVDIENRDLMDVVDAKCFWFAMVIPGSIASSADTDADATPGKKSSGGYTASTGTGKDSSDPSTRSGGSLARSSEASISNPSSFGSAFGEYCPPAELGKITLGPLLGSGSFGKVYRAISDDTIPVAVKVIDCRGRDEGATSDQLAEVKLSVSLDHPGVVKTVKHGTSKQVGGDGKAINVAWIVQELCDLGQLTDAAERGWFREKRHITAPCDMTRVLPTLRDIAEAMAYVHSKNVIHADLTGRNVLLHSAVNSRGFVAKVCDFGISRLTKDEAAIPTSVLGTVTHMPPELLKDKLLVPAADVWAFGVIAWEAWYGKKCYCGKNPPQVIMTVVKNNPLEWPAEASEDFKALMARCMAFDYKERLSFKGAVEELDSLVNAMPEGTKRQGRAAGYPSDFKAPEAPVA